MKFDIHEIVYTLEKASKNWNVPVVTLISLQEKAPFKVLLSTLISLRTKDEVTIQSSKRLFKILKHPKDIYNITAKQIEDAIYPAGFYKQKSIRIIEICKRLAEEYQSQVPKDIPTLLTFKGIGRKTANLILAEGYSIPAVCVDTHVHRISNRLGYVHTKTPDETEFALREKLPKQYWIKYNTLLVAFGQKICRPISPHCTLCPINKYCEKINVNKHR